MGRKSKRARAEESDDDRSDDEVDMSSAKPTTVTDKVELTAQHALYASPAPSLPAGLSAHSAPAQERTR